MIENENLKKISKEKYKENEFIKEKLIDMGKFSAIITELETKIKYLSKENEKLNKIIITRCKDIFKN